MSSDAAKGQEALKIADYAAAINHLTTALKTSQSPLWLIQRSTAYQRTKQHELALADADNALLASINRGKRDLIATSHFRRAVALHGMGRFGDARLCLNWCMQKNAKEKCLTMWMAKVKSDYEKAGGEEAECNKKTVKEIPDKVEEVVKPKEEKKAVEKHKVAEVNNAPLVSVAPVAPATTPKEKIRTEWYQSTNTVTVEVFAKGIPKESAEVKIGSSTLHVSFPIGNASSFEYSIDPLFSEIAVSKSTFRITPHKIEIVLHKSFPGLKWSSLEDPEPDIPLTRPGKPTSSIPDGVLRPKETAPIYPTSSKNGPVNWDKVGGDDDQEEHDVNDFFKVLYRDADPDTRRAMMKSYQESNGTSLSTDWSDVGSKTFKTEPPEGMEPKKWES
ncbi:hypothetical protein LZ554_008649 [Drepanopeziza brunnea f. sp. 'monogermtubi']|nr:hypothetical protein LZ554_008649 [Drepanopeziza brunnea f. sp. 'monogermtubi']